MARPTPEIFEEHPMEKYYIEQIIDCEGVYAVTYKGKPFNLKQINTIAHFPPRYKRTLFNNEGHAINLCEKLTQRFGKYFKVEELL